eukprot:Pgem_evm1s7248
MCLFEVDSLDSVFNEFIEYDENSNPVAAATTRLKLNLQHNNNSCTLNNTHLNNNNRIMNISKSNYNSNFNKDHSRINENKTNIANKHKGNPKKAVSVRRKTLFRQKHFIIFVCNNYSLTKSQAKEILEELVEFKYILTLPLKKNQKRYIFSSSKI